MNRPSSTPPRAPETLPDVVVCAIGDVHGRLDLLEAATEELRRTAQIAAANHKGFVAVFLGDYVDRGPDSRGVVSHLIAFQREELGEVIFLRGNHEQVMLDLADGVDDTLPWLDFGGVETLRSYGVDKPVRGNPASGGELGRQIVDAVPAAHLQFLRDTRLYAKCGDYLFVHAGLRPDRLLEEQSEADMLWFRYYTDEPPVHGEFVVHGHSTNEQPILGRWRIGIDTEAYSSGALTMLRLDGAEQEFLRISASEGDNLPHVGPWPSIATSYTRRRSSADKPAVATSPATERSPGGGFGRLVLLAGAATIVIGGATVFVAHRLGLGASPPTASKAATAGPQAAAVQRVEAPTPLSEPMPPIGLRAHIEGPAPAAEPAAKPSALSALLPPKATDSQYARVQIGALDSPDLAERAWRDMERRFPQLMKSKTLKVEPIDAQGKTLYRAYVVGFDSADSARQFCRQIGEADRACIVRVG